MALTALERSTIGEVSGIGVTLIANPWKQLIKNCLWSVNWKVFDMSLRLLVVQSKFPSGKWKSNKTKKKCIHSLDESWLGDGCIRWRLTRGGGWGLSVRWTNGIGACIRHIAIEKKKKQHQHPRTNKKKDRLRYWNKDGKKAAMGRRMSQTKNNEELFTRRDDQVGLVAGCFIAQRVLLAFDGRG